MIQADPRDSARLDPSPFGSRYGAWTTIVQAEKHYGVFGVVD